MIETVEAATYTALWAAGFTQREIARHFGHKNSTRVCAMVGRFIARYAGAPVRTYEEGYAIGQPVAQGLDRQKLAKKAVRIYEAQSGRIIEIPILESQFRIGDMVRHDDDDGSIGIGIIVAIAMRHAWCYYQETYGHRVQPLDRLTVVQPVDLPGGSQTPPADLCK